ncbi:dihydrolipoamide acetyltransferase family protein [Streptomyces sp. NPDC127068]|uniref:dihydrolipoamide acetyltransferase family protein n=1 Tax=Streptomyces sp. NPDC127068 TaxID=3347127 RepID=UPI00365A2B8C
MAQVLEFKLPDLGEGLTEAEIVRWLVEVGDVVAVDQPVVEVETAKAMVEVPCPYGGVVTARFGEEGTELPVGAPLITVAVGAKATEVVPAGATDDPHGTGPQGPDGPPGPHDTDPSGTARTTAGSAGFAGSVGSAGSPGGAPAAPSGDTASGNVLVGYGTAAAPARRRRVRRGALASAGSTPTPLPAARGEGPAPVISPLVRKLAREHGIDLAELAGSGPDGLILRADVEYALAARTHLRAVPGQEPAPAAGIPTPPRSPAAPAPTRATTPAAPAIPPAAASAERRPSAVGASGGTRIPLRGVRGAVADKLARSRREIPEATVWVDADATELLRARTAMNAAGGPRISLLALLARICVAGLARHPELNATVDPDAREIVQFDAVHLGFAAQTPRGLVVPVVKDAHTRGAESLSTEVARLADRAREGALSPAELTGGTFTLNNYGVFGVDGSTPIINHPEAAMLGVGRIIPRPWVHEGELAVRQVVELTLTFDHRVCDGGTAGGFLRYVADCVEQPAVLLRTL